MTARSPARSFGRPVSAQLYRHCGGCSALVPLSEWQEGPLGCDDCRRAGAKARAGAMTPPTEATTMSISKYLREPANDTRPAICIGQGEGARRARRSRFVRLALRLALLVVAAVCLIAARRLAGFW